MTVPRTIGVLGGMGPEATILFQSKLLKAVAAQDDSDHIPLLIDMNSQVPSRISYLLENTGPNPGPVLAAMARRLEASGAAALVMPCNTAHNFAGDITDAVDIPLLSMVDLTADHAADAAGHGARVGLLGSPGLRRTGLYDAALKQRGLEPLWPDDMASLLAAIRAIKAGQDLASAKEALVQGSRQLTDDGADIQFVACSEFSIIASALDAEVHAVDTVDLLVTAAADFSLGREGSAARRAASN